jgi:hypothetical protein
MVVLLVKEYIHGPMEVLTKVNSIMVYVKVKEFGFHRINRKVIRGNTIKTFEKGMV